MRRNILVPLLLTTALVLLVPPQCRGFRHLKEGEPTPGFSLVDTEGKPHALSDYMGKVVLLTYWRLGQDRSVDALRALKVINEQFKDQPLSILTVTKDVDNVTSLKETKKTLDLTFPVLLDSKEEVYSQFGVFVFPSTALIDKRGICRYHYGGFREDFLDVVSPQVNIVLGLASEESLQGKTQEGTSPLSEEQKRAQNHLNLGKTLKKRGMDEKALEEFKQAVALDGANPGAHILLGFALLDQDEVEQALIHFNRGIELDPKSTDAKIGLGRTYRMQGETNKSLGILQSALNLSPDSAFIHLELGEAYESLGKTAEAMKHYKASAEYALKKQDRF